MTRNKNETIGIFSGIGGFELGLGRAGYRTRMICEIDPGARAVLRRRFQLNVEPDVRKLESFPRVDLVAAGFPCQDLSQAGRTAGIIGNESRLIDEVFKRLGPRSSGPRWLLLENVPFILQLQRGRAMRYLVWTNSRLLGSHGHTAWSTRALSASRNNATVSCFSHLEPRTRGPRSSGVMPVRNRKVSHLRDCADSTGLKGCADLAGLLTRSQL